MNTLSASAFKKWLPDIFGGTTAMLVALPSAIAFGIVIYAAIGPGYTAQGAMAGILGTIALGLVASLTGSTKRLISAPCAPAAAILVVFVQETSAAGIAPAQIPLMLLLVGAMAGVIQVAAGALKGGRFIKYIPFPVVAGYLSGVGALIFIAQFPKLVGLPKDIDFVHSFVEIDRWIWHSLVVGCVTIAAMVLVPKITKRIPAAVLALLCGVTTYFILGLLDPALLTLKDNPFIIGPIVSGNFSFGTIFIERWGDIDALSIHSFKLLIIPALTLATLLSIDTLKTCLVLNALTRSRSDANKELIGQGLGNLTSAVACGMPGAGTMGATLVNVSSGGETRISGLVEGVTALLVLIAFGQFIAWIPISALAGILIVVAVRMVDRKILGLLKRRSSIMDFAVILGVVVAAVSLSLIWAAGVGIVLSIILFLRDQILRPVVRRKLTGAILRSKQKRVLSAMAVLSEQGHRNLIFELQGQLFFGTTDQLMTEIEPELSRAKNVILDMRHVQAVDYSAAYVLHQIEARIADRGGRLIFAALPSNEQATGNIREYLEGLGFVASSDSSCFFNSMDEALEWAEDSLLAEANVTTDSKDTEHILELSEHPFFERVSKEALAALEEIVKKETFSQGESIFQRGDPGEWLYFIAGGNVKVVVPLENGTIYHVATFGKGDFFGDIAFLDRQARTADAVAHDQVTLFALSRQSFDALSLSHPRTTTIVFEQLARILALRLRQTNLEVEALERA